MKKKKFISEMPELIKEWDCEANADLDPTKITHGSNKKAWWICHLCGHKWQTPIASRGLKHCGCPCCAGRVPQKGINDLKTVNPHLASEWHPTKNGGLKPTDVIVGSNKRVWWLCKKCGHEWQTLVKSRGLNRTGCPRCAKKKRSTSQLEFDFNSKA